MIGIFDSGVGGLSVLAEVRRCLPQADVIYLADTAHFPFGEKPQEDIVAYTDAGIKFLNDQGADQIVVACNTATVNGLDAYRKSWPKLKLIGTTPPLESAAQVSHTKKILVLATFATLASRYFNQARELLPKRVTVYTQAAFEWIRLVEAGQTESLLITDQVKTFAAYGIDTIVAGSTHLAFLAPSIRAAAPGLTVIDPAASVVEQLNQEHGAGEIGYLVTGEPMSFNQVASKLLGQKIEAERVSL